jgi:hypothetical protein
MSEMIPWCERVAQGARNSARAVATIMSGVVAPRSASSFNRLRDVLEHLPTSSLFLELAVAQDRDVMAHALDRRHIMRDEEIREPISSCSS